MLKLEQSQKQNAVQTFAMNQSMQLSLKILQLSNLELFELINQELDSNPFLSDESSEGEITVSHFQNEKLYSLGSGTEYDISLIADKDISLKTFITNQINASNFDNKEKEIAFILLDSLEENGYISKNFLKKEELELFSDEEILLCLHKLQELDPPGVFARDLQECLELQLHDKNLYDKDYKIILENLELLAKNDISSLCKLTGLNKENIILKIKVIKNLNPKPGNLFASEQEIAVNADVIMTKNNKDWLVEINNQILPKLIIDRKYFSIIKNSNDSEILNNYYNNANSIIQAIDQRAKTLLKVSTQIVKNQISFFDYGVSSLKPMTIKLLSEQLGLHESTISRVCANKYILTPLGLLPFKYFFSTSIENESNGKQTSNKVISNLIKELIMQESAENILSDDDIVEILNKRNINIARRTVAKYRTQLKIPPSHLRKQKNKLQAANK